MLHSKLYSTTGISNTKSKRGDDISNGDHDFWDDLDLLDLYRSSSCPPGTLHIPQANSENCNGYGAPLKTRDDMTRRPSRVTLYQSTSSPIGQEEFTDINDHHVAKFNKEDYFKALTNQGYYAEAEEGKPTYDEDISKGDLKAKFREPRINIHPYPTPGPNDPPEWNMATTQPYTWTDWSSFQFDQSCNSSGIVGMDTNTPLFTNPFLSTLPPYPDSYDPHDIFSSVDCISQPSFTSSKTEAPSTYSPLDKYQSPDAHVQKNRHVSF